MSLWPNAFNWQDFREGRYFWPVLAGLGVMFALLVFALLPSRQSQVRFAPALHYDMIFKHCVTTPSLEASGRFDRSLYELVRGLTYGTYSLSGGGQLHVYDGGLFELQLPPDRHALRSLSAYNIEAQSDHARPHTLIGCNRSQMVAVLDRYNLRPVARIEPGRAGAIPPPLHAPAAP